MAKKAYQQSVSLNLRKESYLLGRILFLEDQLSFETFYSIAQKTQMNQFCLEALCLALKKFYDPRLVHRGDGFLRKTPFALLAFRFHTFIAYHYHQQGKRNLVKKRLQKALGFYQHILLHTPEEQKKALENLRETRILKTLLRIYKPIKPADLPPIYTFFQKRAQGLATTR